MNTTYLQVMFKDMLFIGIVHFYVFQMISLINFTLSTRKCLLYVTNVITLTLVTSENA